MSAGRILWGQVGLVLSLVVAGIWGATQWTAWRLGYQTQLGEPWLVLGGLPLYPPPAFFLWWFVYDAYAPAIFLEGAAIVVGGVGLAQGALGVDVEEGPDGAVDGGDAVEVGLGELA